jgi:hypothetical protein
VSFWLPDETVVYIGKATSLASRVGSYYRTKLGATKPHAGGVLTVLDKDALAQLRVHYARVEDPQLAEEQMIRSFCAGVSDAACAALHDPQHPFPFANLEWRTGGRRLIKARGLCGATGELS